MRLGMSLKCQSINLIDSLFGYRFEFDVGSTYNPGLIQLLTKISFWVALHWGDADYRREHHAVSAWAVVPGWRLETCFRDPMHILYLGTCRDLYPSALGYWLRNKLLVYDGTMNQQLREVSVRLKEECRAEGNLSLLVDWNPFCFPFHPLNLKVK